MSMPTYLGMPAFPEAAATALQDSQLRRNLAHATGAIRVKRAAAVAELSDWAELRAAAKAIKDHTLANLDIYLVRLEERVVSAGGQVHWAADAAEANDIVISLVRAAGADQVVKVKSMVTQETGLNEALAAEHIHALETDLAELIIQLDGDRPSHILVPAIQIGKVYGHSGDRPQRGAGRRAYPRAGNRSRRTHHPAGRGPAQPHPRAGHSSQPGRNQGHLPA